MKAIITIYIKDAAIYNKAHRYTIEIAKRAELEGAIKVFGLRPLAYEGTEAYGKCNAYNEFEEWVIKEG